jgi:hypothetical protein
LLVAVVRIYSLPNIIVRIKSINKKMTEKVEKGTWLRSFFTALISPPLIASLSPWKGIKTGFF